MILHHKPLYRKLNDIRGYHYLERDKTLKEFIRWAYDTLRLASFDAVLYYYYIIQCINYRSDIFGNIISYLNKNKLLPDDANSYTMLVERFDSKEDGVRWVVAYRSTRMYFDSKLRELDEASKHT